MWHVFVKLKYHIFSLKFVHPPHIHPKSKYSTQKILVCLFDLLLTIGGWYFLAKLWTSLLIAVGKLDDE